VILRITQSEDSTKLANFPLDFGWFSAVFAVARFIQQVDAGKGKEKGCFL
jgi:hypothetical protein